MIDMREMTSDRERQMVAQASSLHGASTSPNAGPDNPDVSIVRRGVSTGGTPAPRVRLNAPADSEDVNHPKVF